MIRCQPTVEPSRGLVAAPDARTRLGQRQSPRVRRIHIHFGFDAIGPEVLSEVVHELKMHDKPLVYTVHDLRNPHHPEPDAHAEQQDVLLAAGHTVITLTPGAARAINQRWNRSAQVLPHPHVLSPASIEQPGHNNERFVAAVHAKSLCANMDPLPVI
jgi:hypothetical protein